jgi:hypothetical protein
MQQINKAMLKRRPSKRFVLAETGEETAWDTVHDNDPVTIPQIDIGLVSDIVGEECPPIVEPEEIQPHPKAQRLSVPQTIKSGMK